MIWFHLLWFVERRQDWGKRACSKVHKSAQLGPTECLLTLLALLMNTIIYDMSPYCRISGLFWMTQKPTANAFIYISFVFLNILFTYSVEWWGLRCFVWTSRTMVMWSSSTTKGSPTSIPRPKPHSIFSLCGPWVKLVWPCRGWGPKHMYSIVSLWSRLAGGGLFEVVLLVEALETSY